MAARQPKVMTWGLVVLTVAVIAIVAAVIIGAVSKKGGVGKVQTAQQQGHTLMPVTRATVKTCLSNQGIVVTDRAGGKLEASEPGAKPVQLTFEASFDEASASVEPGHSLNNVVLSTDVTDLTQLEIYAFDACIVQPGERGGKGTIPKKAPAESVTS